MAEPIERLPELKFKDELPSLKFEKELPPLDFSKQDIFGGGRVAPLRPPDSKDTFGKAFTFDEPWAEKFIIDHPNIYGLYGMVEGTAEELTKWGHLKYFYGEEREKLSKLPTRMQTRQLLMDTLEDVGALGVGRIVKGLGGIAGNLFEKYLPRLHEFMTTPIKLGSKKYKKLLQDIVDEDLSMTKGEEPQILQLIRRDPYEYLKSPRPATPQELGVSVVAKEAIPRPKPPLKQRGMTAEVMTKKMKVDAFRKEKGLPPIKGPPIDELKAAQRRSATQKMEEFRRSKGLRSIAEILKDVNNVVGKRGSVGGKIEGLSTEQKKALARLMQDAQRAGQSIDDFLRESGFDQKAIAVLSRYTTQLKPLPKYAQSVNLEKQDISESAKRLEVEMAGEKKYQSWDTTDRLSDSILANPEKWKTAFNKTKGLKGLTENMDAIRKVNVNGIDRLAKMEREFATGRMSEEAFQKEFALMRDDIFKVLSEGSSEIGRALNAHKKIIGSTDQLAKGLSKIEGRMNPRQREMFREAVKNMENPVAIQRFLNTVDDPTLKDYVMEFWYNSILSGPPTHGVNVISNTIWGAYQVAPHRPLVAIIDKYYAMATGKERTRVINEIVPMLAGYKRGFRTGRTRAWEMMKHGEMIDIESKWAQDMGLASVGAWARSPHPWMRKVAPYISVPTKALRAMDVWANAIAYDGEMMSIATRKGVLKGLKGDKLKSFVDDFVRKPPDEAHEQAMKMSKHATFMDDPDAFTKAFIAMRKIPGGGPLLQFIVPFVNTIGNLLKRGVEMTPGVGILKEAAVRGFAKKPGMGTPELIAKQIEGSMLALYTMYKFEMGEITGAAPENPAERERFYAEGKKPWAFRFGDTWVSYRRVEPFNTVFAAAAIFRDKIKNAKDEDTAITMFGDMVSSFKDNLLDSSYFKGMQQVFDRYQSFEAAPGRFVASFIPYSSFWRSLNRVFEKLTEGEAKFREKGSWLAPFAQVIPFLSGQIPAELNIWGEEKINPGSVLQHWLPYKWSKETTDFVEIELSRLNESLRNHPKGLKVYPGQPSQWITLKNKKIKLGNKAYRDYLLDLGKELRTVFEKTIRSSGYQNATDDKRAIVLNKRTDAARDKIRRKLIHFLNKQQGREK